MSYPRGTSISELMKSIPKIAEKAKIHDEIMVKTLEICVEIKDELRKISENINQLLEDLHNYIEMSIEMQKNGEKNGCTCRKS